MKKIKIKRKNVSLLLIVATKMFLRAGSKPKRPKPKYPLLHRSLVVSRTCSKLSVREKLIQNPNSTLSPVSPPISLPLSVIFPMAMLVDIDTKTELGFPYWKPIRRRFGPESPFFSSGNIERELLAKQVITLSFLPFHLPLLNSQNLYRNSVLFFLLLIFIT